MISATPDTRRGVEEKTPAKDIYRLPEAWSMVEETRSLLETNTQTHTNTHKHTQTHTHTNTHTNTHTQTHYSALSSAEMARSGTAGQSWTQERRAEAIDDLRHLGDEHAMSRRGVARTLPVAAVADCITMDRMCDPREVGGLSLRGVEFVDVHDHAVSAQHLTQLSIEVWVLIATASPPSCYRNHKA